MIEHELNKMLNALAKSHQPPEQVIEPLSMTHEDIIHMQGQKQREGQNLYYALHGLDKLLEKIHGHETDLELLWRSAGQYKDEKQQCYYRRKYRRKLKAYKDLANTLQRRLAGVARQLEACIQVETQWLDKWLSVQAQRMGMIIGPKEVK